MEFSKLSAVDMTDWVRQKKVSPVELVQAHLAHIERLNPVLNAFVHLCSEEALRSAASAEREAMSGSQRPLLGVPVSIKSCMDVAGVVCEAGSRLRVDYVAPSDAVLVTRLKAAGAIVIGTTNTAESLLAYETDNALFGRTKNPWNLECSPGGSSGGEAAAIASGMSAAGFGSDGGGSVRVPAHFTGICALKPTPGRIPGTGHFPECIGPWAMMGVVGPMARTVGDLRALLDATAGPDDGDPFAAHLAQETTITIRGARIGILETDWPVADDLVLAVRDAAKALEDAGAIVEPFHFPRLDEAIEIWRLIFVRAADEVLRASRADASLYGATMRDFVAYAATLPRLTAAELLTALLERDRIRAEYLRAVKPYAALITPPAANIAFRYGEGGWGPSHPADYIQTMRQAQVANVFGLPAAVVPVRLASEGLPVGIQIVGRPYEEQIVLDVAALIEKRFGYVPPPLHNASHAAA